MSWVRAAVVRHPLVAFFTLAYAFTWALLPFAAASRAVALLSLFGPAAAAAVIARIEGAEAWRELRERLLGWRVPTRWYLLAISLPFLVSILSSGIQKAAGAPGPVAPLGITPLALVVFVLVYGEEAGWRGFAQPRLSHRLGQVRAAMLVGALWALWHLPLFFMRGMPQHGDPIPPYLLYTVGLSGLLGVLGARTRWSVPIATLFHGAVNSFIVTAPGATPVQRGWGDAVAYLGAAIVAAVAVRATAPPTDPPGGARRRM